MGTVGAHAQGMGGGHKHQKQTGQTDSQKWAALKSVPDKPKPDPWQGAR